MARRIEGGRGGVSLRGCSGFRVERADGSVGLVDGVVPGTHALSVRIGRSRVVARLADVEQVETDARRILLRASAPLVEEPAPAPACGHVCPVDFACGGCGYGVSAGHLPVACPMCGGRTWRPVRRAT